MQACLGLVVLIAAACSNDAGESPEVRLFTEVEIAGYEAALMARIAESTKRRCVRPVVREPGTDTAATPDLIALVEPAEPFATCHKKLRELSNKPGMTMAKLLESRDPKLVELDASCGDALEQLLRKAAVHRDACSPYQVGVRKDPEAWMPALGSARLVAERARLSAERGTPGAALAMLLDAASAYRDLGRGRVHMIGPIIAVVSTDILLDQARAIVTTTKLAPPDLEALVAGVDALLASEPPHADAMNGERDSFDLYHAMPLLQGKTWVPPGGGWPEGMGPGGSDAKGPYSTKTMSMSPRDEAAIMFAASEQMATERDRACPATATLKACHDGMLALADAASKLDAKEVGETMWADLIKAAKTGDATAIAHRIRATMINIVTSIGHPPLSRYTGKRAGGYARIAALRIHLEVLRAGHCPSVAELAAPPYAALLVPTALGDAVTVTRLDDGDLEVSPPAWVETKKSPWRISCKLR